MRRLHPLRLGAILLTLVGCTADAPLSEAGRPDFLAPLVSASGLVLGSDSLVVRAPSAAYEAWLGHPQIQAEGSLPAPAARVNRAIRDSVRALAEILRPEAAPAGVMTDPVRVESFWTSDLFTDSLLSAVLLVHVSSEPRRSPPDLFVSLTYDLAGGRPVRLADLFRPGAPYLDTLARRVERAYVDLIEAESGLPRRRIQSFIEPTALADIREGRVAFRLAPDGLYVHLSGAQFAPSFVWSQWRPEDGIAVPYDALQSMASPDSPLTRLGAE